MFNSFISDWAGPHNHLWASANIKIKAIGIFIAPRLRQLTVSSHL